jgi:hypothetical protein
MAPPPQELEGPLDIRHRALIGRSRTRIRRLVGCSRRRIDPQHGLGAVLTFLLASADRLTKTLAHHVI